MKGERVGASERVEEEVEEELEEEPEQALAAAFGEEISDGKKRMSSGRRYPSCCFLLSVFGVNACGLANSPLDREKWLSALGIRLRPFRAE
ncbi:hypothetical protein HZH68_016541 [Vespula germanica]|uniref:Uncharacterized protein n=1 Tax=Vespula germanica TaxID=30212 RepID=A0A834J1Y9_VESGE|nr:hypothetical protein HZH68_016541 [Vespula germanica]